MTTSLYGQGDVINVTASGAKSSGDVEEFAGCIGIWSTDVADTAVGAVIITGEHTLTKETPLVISQGDKVYWDATNNRVDKTNTNIPLGVCTVAAASADTTVTVRLNPGC